MARSPEQSREKPAVRKGAPDPRQVIDRLPCSFEVGTDESGWLLTLLGADELRYIFEGSRHDVND